MKIENVPLQIHIPSQIEAQLPLNDLQKNYLASLKLNESIHDMVMRFLNMGWIVNFKELYLLLELLMRNHFIQQKDVIYYYNQALNLKNIPTTSDSALATQVTVDHAKSIAMALPFFRTLPEPLVKLMILNATVKSFKPDELICREGDTQRDLYVLISGEAAIYKKNPQNESMKFLSFLKEKAVFGESGYLLGYVRSAHIKALKSSQVLCVPYESELLEKYLNKEKAEQLQHRFWIQHALYHSTLFKTIPADCLDALTFSGKVKLLKKDQFLFQQNQLSQSAYILIQGELLIHQNNQVINRLQQGAFLGEISLLLTGGRRTASVSAAKDCLVMEISCASFYELLANNLFLAKEIHQLAEERQSKDASRTAVN